MERDPLSLRQVLQPHDLDRGVIEQPEAALDLGIGEREHRIALHAERSAGQARTRFRESLEKPSLLTPTQEYTISVKLWGTSNLFKRGHRIRVHITSSNFPRYNRNLNSGKSMAEEAEADIRIAHQTILHNRTKASVIVLPIVPKRPTS